MEEQYYLVTASEIRGKTFKVKASSLEKAKEKVKDAYEEDEVYIDPCYYDVDISGREVTDEDLDWYEEVE